AEGRQHEGLRARAGGPPGAGARQDARAAPGAAGAERAARQRPSLPQDHPVGDGRHRRPRQAVVRARHRRHPIAVRPSRNSATRGCPMSNQSQTEGAAASTELAEGSLLDQIMETTRLKPNDEGYDVAKRGIGAFIAELVKPTRKDEKVNNAIVDQMI